MHDPEFLAALRTNAFEVLADQCPVERVHRHIDGDEPFDAELWRTICELGWPMLAVPEAHGGLADGIAAPALVHEALGAYMAPLPFAGSCLLATALSDWPDREIASALLPLLAHGQVVGAAMDFASHGCVKARRHGDVVELVGTVPCLDALGADWLVLSVVDSDTGKAGLAVIGLSGMHYDRRPVADRTRNFANIDLTGLWISSGQAFFGEGTERLAARLEQLGYLLVAADAVGGATALLDATVEYLKTRVQFGRPIGSFQALKHRIADCKATLEMARSQLAAAREGEDGANGWILAAMAKASATECYVAIAKEAIQMHGGIAYTWEHPAHIFLKRATLDRALLGGTARLQDAIAYRLLESAQ